MWNTHRVAAVMVAATGLSIQAVKLSAQYLPVYGGPTMAPDGVRYLTIGLRGVNDDGTVIGAARRFNNTGDFDNRGVVFDRFGNVRELASLGVGTTGLGATYPNGINAAGIVIGSSNKYDLTGQFQGQVAARWSWPQTAATQLESLGTDSNGRAQSYAYSINDAGEAVGYSTKYDASHNSLGERAVRWDASTTAVTELGNLGTSTTGSTHSRAQAINRAGTAVGYAIAYDQLGNYVGRFPTRWGSSGAAVALMVNNSPNGNTDAEALSINDAGVVLGRVGERAVRWDASGAATELGVLGTDSSGHTSVYPQTISNGGTSIGQITRYDAQHNPLGIQGVRWDGGSTNATELEFMPAGGAQSVWSVPLAINATNGIVGWTESRTFAGEYVDRAVYWPDGHDGIDLNSLIDPASGWVLTSAARISDNGWIVGHGDFDPDGAGPAATIYGRTFLLQIPEPLPLFTAAIATACLFVRRRGLSSG